MSGDVAIGRLSACLNAGGGTVRDGDGPRGPAEARLARLLEQVAGERLERALQATDLPPGRWFIRRVHVPVVLDFERSDGALADQWARALVAALRREADERRDGVVRYADDLAPLADAVAGIAAGRTGCAWAWTRAGVLRAGDPSPSAEPAAAVLAILRRRPEHAVPALVRAVETCGVPRIDRVLGRRGWRELAELVLPGGLPVGARAPDGGSPRLAGRLVAGSALAAAFGGARLRPDPETLAAWAVLVAAEADPASLGGGGAGPLVAAVVDRLKPSSSGPVTIDRAPAGVPPAAGPGARTPDVATQDRTGAEGADGAGRAGDDGAGARAGGAGTSEDTAGGTGASGAEAGGTGAADAGAGGTARAGAGRDGAAGARDGRAGAHGAAPRGTESGAVRAGADAAGRAAASGNGDVEWAPPEPTTPAVEGVATAWAGLPFLLATAGAAGLPKRAVEELAFNERPLRWVLYAAGRALVPAAPDDPAVLALAGTPADRGAALIHAAPATPAEQEALDRLARDWAMLTAARLTAAAPPAADEPADDPMRAIHALAHRPGRVVGAPGWIEVRLPLAQVDLRLRRAGLDIDPGWVPWLGTVVRYVYE
jgi:hypothetical protein